MTDEEMAENYIKSNNLEWELECHRTSPIGEIKQAYLAGAEFGYNKCKEEINQKGLALQSDMDKTIEQNVALKKENEELRSQLNSYTKYIEYIIKLEAQIEQMKCCGNCGKWENCDKDEMFSQNICDNWEDRK